MNIILSGGWGYGNLGDDAILYTSLNLISERFPNARIQLLTYDPEQKLSLNSNVVTIQKSAHRVLFNDSAYRMLSTYGKVKSLSNYPDLIRRIIKKYNFIKYNSLLGTNKVDLSGWDNLETCFKQADLYIMSGGGYFNNWKESLISRCTELELAAKYDIPSYILGQSLDNFYDYYKPYLQLVLKTCRQISVRDKLSIEVLKELKINAVYSPDLVVSQSKKNINVQDEIAFIPATCHPSNRRSVAKGIITISQKYNLKVNIIITRLYDDDIIEAKWYFSFFKHHKLNANMRIPGNLDELINDISNKKYIISRNLHGLILGIVNGGEKLLCLNNQPKFISFMEQIGQSKYIIDANTATDIELVNLFTDMYQDSYNLEDIKAKLARTVRERFNSLFDLL